MTTVMVMCFDFCFWYRGADVCIHWRADAVMLWCLQIYKLSHPLELQVSHFPMIHSCKTGMIWCPVFRICLGDQTRPAFTDSKFSCQSFMDTVHGEQFRMGVFVYIFIYIYTLYTISLQLTFSLWKWMVGRRLFPFWSWHIFAGASFVSST